MRIFLTGGTGFIGSHFLKAALAAEHSVLALRRNPISTPRIPIDQQPDWLNCQLDQVSAAQISGCDVLVHFAAHSVQYPFDNLINCLQWNVIAVLALFEQARLAGIQRYIVAGSCFEYGRSGERYEAIPTDAPLEPTNTYAASKAAASIALHQWAEEQKMSMDILRIFHAFGEGASESTFWPTLRRAAMAGDDFAMTQGEQVRDFISAKDAAEVFLKRAELSITGSKRPQIFNLSSGHPSSIRSFAEHWWKEWKATGKLLYGEIPYREGEVMRYVAGANILTPDRA